MSEWVTSAKLTKETGYSWTHQKSRIQRRLWRLGIEYAVVDGLRVFNVEAIDARTNEIAKGQRCPDELVRRRRRKAAPRLLT